MKENPVTLAVAAAAGRRAAGGVIATFIGLGLIAIHTREDTGRSKQGVLTDSVGAAARWLGGVEVSFGMILVMVLFRSPRARLSWSIAWAVAAGVCLVAMLRI